MVERTFDERYDLILHAGRVFCAASGLDGPNRIAIRNGRIAAIGTDLNGSAEQAFSFPNAAVLPGLIDLHAHPAKSGSVFGVDPDRWMLPSGTTTAASQGDAGANNLPEYLDRTIRNSRTRVRLAINLSRSGESTAEGCFASLEDADVDSCVAAVERHREFIWAIAVNVSHHACGATDPREVLRRGLRVASRTGLPLLFGMRRPEDWPLAEQLAPLRAGDVVTYCFRSQPHCIVGRQRVLPEVREARDRGVLFDVGHGTASFDFTVAEAAIRDGFSPTTVSTDLQLRHIEQRVTHDLPLVMSKLQAAGMSENDVFTAVTKAPAEILGLDDEVGTLRRGSCADLVVLRHSEAPSRLTDCGGDERMFPSWKVLLTVRGGVAFGHQDF